MDYSRLILGYFRCFTFLLLMAGVFLGCNRDDRAQIITLSHNPNYRPTTPEEIQDVEQLLGTIITIAKEDLKLPAPIPSRIYLHKDTRSFSAAVASRTNLDVTRLAAIAINSEIHANREISKDIVWGGQVWVWAHEYAHVMENSLRADKLNQVVWFSEGFAEWFAAQILDNLGWQDYSASVYRAKLEIAQPNASFVPLSYLHSGDGWSEIVRQPLGWAKSYSLALFAVATLEQRFGRVAILKYLTAGNFEDAFGESQNDFENNFVAGLQRKNEITTIPVFSPKPEWRIGDEWTYQGTRAGRHEISARTVSRRDKLFDQNLYVIEAGETEYLHDEQSLALIAVKNAGQFVTRITNGSNYFIWPLVLGKGWRYTGYREDIGKSAKRQVDLEMVVTGSQKVSVGRESFDVVKINGFGHDSGRLLVEYWYAPRVKSFVKSRRYSNEGVIDEDLISFKLR